MLTQDMNDRIARVGPGTPGGELFRRYWLPFMPSAKLDEDPVQPVRLLGEDLTCYKDKSGNVGLGRPAICLYGAKSCSIATTLGFICMAQFCKTNWLRRLKRKLATMPRKYR